MAGLLYLPRIFVYHAEQIEAGKDDLEVFVTMERKLFHFIMDKAIGATWLFGVLLMLTPGVVDFSSYWFWIKMSLVIAMSGFHFWLGRRQDDFENGVNSVSSRTFRMVNEIPAVIMIFVVVMVVVKPF